MHFNDLMMRWRLQAIGGMAALVTLAGFVVGGADDLATRYRAMFILAGLLAFVWVGVALIDLRYYRKLLKGAVLAIEDLEGRTEDLRLSTKIEEVAKRPGRWAPYAFYISGFIPLVGIVIWASVNLAGLAAVTPATDLSPDTVVVKLR
jgi:MFS family permease